MSYQVEQFHAKLERAMERVRLVLHTNRAPCFAADVHHKYQDKYMLAESMTNAALASQTNALASLGLTCDQIEQMRTWAQTSAVSLRFQSEERCAFVREESREVEDPTKRVVEGGVIGVFAGKLTSKTVTKVTEYFWKYDASYELLAVRGVGQNADDKISILKRGGEVELKTSIKESPHPSEKVPAAHFEVNVTWLVKQLQLESGSIVPHFAIDRAHAKCHTPRRNSEVDAACDHFSTFRGWTGQIAAYVGRLMRVRPADSDVKIDWSALNTDALFVPVLPLLEDQEHAALSDGAAAAAESSSAAEGPGGLLACLAGAVESSGTNLGVADTNRFLSEEVRQMQERRENLTKAFGADGTTLTTAAQAVLVVTMSHCSDVSAYWSQAVDYIESMLRKQLIAAIGKEVMPGDFAEFMQFHNRKLFADAYAPIPFCFAVRRSVSHSPEGTLSIEQETVGGDSNISAPIITTVAHSAGGPNMEFPLSASSSVSFGGDKYLHAWLSHQFSGQAGASLTLTSRARQFSSFIVLVGRIASATSFDPKYAAIVQNKDELKIPLDLSTIPTPKEFKDAIESLSPQQQAFAKAFRSMQLESTLFGILVIQIKPQLEKVLKLPEDGLTKEIKLTQDLMQLFIKYQIPSDLLAFDPNTGPDGAEIVGSGPAERLAAVKEHVKAMHEMIEQSQQEEVQQRVMEQSYAQPQAPGGMDGNWGADGCDDLFGALMGAGGMDSAPPALCSSTQPTRRGNRNMSASMTKMASSARSMAVAAPAMLQRSMSGGRSAAASAPAANAAPASTQASSTTPQQQTPQHGHPEHSGQVVDAGRDYTKVPKEMDASFERFDTDSQLRPTIITPAGSWTKRAQKALLATPTTTTMYSDEQKKEKDAAFDLLDALTKSGAVPVEHASLHIVVAATHCFDKTVTETVVQDNVNPIDKVERSTLIMASTVHQLPAAELIRNAQLSRVQAASPMLFLDDEAVEVS